MAKNFSLSSILPEADTFTDRTGTKHDILAGRTFGTLEHARLNKFQRDIAKLQDRLDKTDDEDEMVRIATEQENVVNRFVKMVVPTLPDDQLNTTKLFEKLQFMYWWAAQQQVPATSDDTGNLEPGA
jgi:hypothetical protein